MHARNRVGRSGSKGCNLGFTVLELSVAAAILLILGGLLLGNYQKILASVEQAICMSRMREIRVALENYLQDNREEWPQGPSPKEKGWSEFWVETLEPYGISETTWQCPTIKRLSRDNADSSHSLHYVPTRFSSTRNIARRWSTHPWLIEVGDAHGKGPLICFPDGSIKPLARVLAEQGVR